ncbi:MAG: molybdopterin-dependent oxidoreductase, partial [Candidatus Binatia bacterium]
LAADRLAELRRRQGADAVGLYWGNPTGNDHGALLLLGAFTKALGTRNRFSSGSQDANPRLATSLYLYGSTATLPVPDLERTDYLLCVGANPLISNGSVMSVPNVRARLRAIQKRGGRIVVIDPRRTETAALANEHVSIRPGTDAALFLTMAAELVRNDRIDRAFLERHVRGWAEIERRLRTFTVERTAAYTGVAAEVIARLALELADAPTGSVYSRMGVCTGPHATLATYATDLLNIVTGRLGAVGGAMFPTPPFPIADLARWSGLDGHARWKSRVGGLPETLGDLPSTTMVDEMETPGEGRIRALVTFAGNPVLSIPNGRRLDRALEGLEFMVSIDIYLNETTRHADLILPPCWSLAEDHVDLLFTALAVRNTVKWSPPVVEKKADERADWEILLELTRRLGGGPTGEPALDRGLSWLEPLGLRWTPTGFADLLLRTGPYGDKFLPFSGGLNMKKLRAAPHGVDLGPLQPGFEHRLHNRDDRIHLDDNIFLRALDHLEHDMAAPVDDRQLVLIGRRELRSINSWSHNVPALVSGKDRCVLYIHPDDARKRELTDGDTALLESRTHTDRVRVHVTDEMRPGVVSLPHGWGHAATARWQRVAGENAGVSANDWTDDRLIEPIIGQSILNGVPVTLAAAEKVAAA